MPLQAEYPLGHPAPASRDLELLLLDVQMGLHMARDGNMKGLDILREALKAIDQTQTG